MADAPIREFSSGANRGTASGKPDYAGYLSPQVIERFGRYMLKHQVRSDGEVRTSDNWKKGIPLSVYLSSLWRHLMDVWLHLSYQEIDATLEEELCALLFNVQGMLHEVLKARCHHVDQ